MTAQLNSPIGWDTTGHFMLGLIGVLGVVLIIMQIAVASRKLFGKHPPIEQELKAVRDEFQSADASLARALKDECCKREEAFANLTIERARTLGQLHRKMNGISRNVYLIAGKMGITPIPNPDETDL